MDSTTDERKSHREHKTGRKAEKKKKRQQTDEEKRNPKAFAFNSAVRAERRFRRKEDLATKKQHIPLIDRTPLEPPPVLVVIVGPPKVGKTTVLKNLIKLFTKSHISEIKGPVTIVTGKKRRITFIECNNDVNSMIDLAKVADLVLLLCDASFGFEMEVFEFLNICQVHGMPKIMGVLTHLDAIKNSKTLKNTKKTLKHRFWNEVYPGAKLFYLSGIVREDYLKNEIKNLGRFISIITFRPLTWRTTHGYLLGDRYEDLTNQELIRRNPKCCRDISLYGYVRGIPIKNNSSIHIAGLGDMKIHDISFLPDPCPLPEQIKKRALVEKEKLIYAPFSGVGGIVYDKDAVYIDLGGSHSHNHEVEEKTDDIVTNLIDAQKTLDVKMEQSKVQLFSGGVAMTAKEFEEESGEEDEVQTQSDDESDDQDEGEENEINESNQQNLKYNEERVEDSGRIRRKVVFETNDEEFAENLDHAEESEDEDEELSEDDDEEMSEEESDENDIQWKKKLGFKDVQRKNLTKLVYGVFDIKKEDEKHTDENTANYEEDILKVHVRQQQKMKIDKDIIDLPETSLCQPWNYSTRNWLEGQNKYLISNCFVTGKWKESEDASELLKLDDMEALSDEDEVYGDFEDLETGEKHTGDEQTESKKRKKEDEEKEDETYRQELAEKKQKLKEKFNEEYDNGEDKSTYYDEWKQNAEKQAQLNKTVFENVPDDVRVQLEGYRPGMYVRIEVKNVPAEFVQNFDPTYPIVIGALNLGEENIGYVNVKIKKHRWHNKILKSNDPVIVSLGWRRFQTVAIYSKLEDDLKFRYLKYTPQHLACNAHFWGPITPQGTGFLALQSMEAIDSKTMEKRGFRIAATGAVQELDKSTRIMKKLKLIGHPIKVLKKSAFIKGMFTTALEVTRFEGARLKTVSGIRGQIKKPLSKPEGCFRATFEDKILLSDIVFCRTWYKIDVPMFYNPITNLLLPPETKNSWRGVRTLGEIKREKGVKNLPNQDSLYTPIVREERPFKPLVIPPKLQKALPYKDKPKHGIRESDKKKSIERVAVIREPQEQRVVSVMKQLREIYKHKEEKRKEETKKKLEEHRRVITEIELNKHKKNQKKKKEHFRNKKSKVQK